MERQYALSERAHFMCPNMSFGILVKLDGAFELRRFADVLDRLAEAHPFLRAVMAPEEDGRLYYRIGDGSRIGLTVHPEDKAFDFADYELLMRRERNVFEEGLLDVHVYPACDTFEVLLFAHHLLTDGIGLLRLAQELADAYAEGKPIRAVEERLIADVSELPAGSELAGVGRFLIGRANRQWKKENRKVGWQEYADFAARFHEKHGLEFRRYDVDDDTYREMRKTCRENGFTVNDLLMAKMFLSTGAKKIIIAADIRDRLPRYREGALGNYAAALGIVCRSRTSDETEKAKEVHRLVQKALGDDRRLMQVLACYFAMDPSLLDAAAMAGLGGMESRAASFVGGGMFGFSKAVSYSITNLGRIEDPNLLSAMFIPPASPAAILTLGVVTVNGNMTGCSSRCL